MQGSVRSLFALAILILAGVAQAAIPTAERQALLDLYAQTNGTGWTSSINWNGAPGTECNWEGISCDGTQSHVRMIILYEKHLSGTLPPLSALTELAGFEVWNNQLTGPIPSLSGLSNLSGFYAENNQLTGPIPSLSGLSKLGAFIVTNNQLSGQIPSLSGLSALIFFEANYNQLTGPIPSLKDLSSLIIFQVSFNQLSGPIPSLAGLSNLFDFEAFENQLSGPIPSLSDLSSLATFEVGANQLTGPIPPLSGLTNLVTFDVGSNQLTGAIPSLSDLNKLESFYVPVNQLTGPAPLVPNPSRLAMRGSALCPNYLDPAANPPSTNDQAWNTATQDTPWSTRCTAAVSYTVTTQATPAGAGSLVCASPVNAGAISACTATPVAGQVTQSISGCGGTATATGVNGYTTGPVNADCTVTAIFAAVVPTTYTVTAVAGPAGTGSLVCASPVNAGAISTCTATPNAGYGTQTISGCGGTPTGTGANTYTTAAVNADCTVTATFAAAVPTTYTVSAVAAPIGTGSLVCASPVNAGATSTCTATPNAGYVTQTISGCGGTSTTSGVNSYITGAVNASCTVTATFAKTVTNPVPVLLAWPAPAPIAYGTALGAAQLNATATSNGNPVAGTFTYTPAAGTVLNVGANQVLSATFVPSDTASYATPGSPVTTTLTVNAAPLTPVTMTLTASPATISQGQSVLLTATVNGAATNPTAVETIERRASSPASAPAAAVAPTGSVIFKDGGTVIGSVNLDGNGIAALSVSTLAAGTHNVIATYAGDGTFASAMATVSVVIASAAQAPVAAPALDRAALWLLALLFAGLGAAARRNKGRLRVP